jgi:MFS family permease
VTWCRLRRNRISNLRPMTQRTIPMAHSIVPGAHEIETTPTAHRPNSRWLILLMAVAAAICAMMSTISFAPIIGIVAQDLGADLGSASFAFIGVPTAAMAIGMAICGFILDRVGIFRIVIASLLTLIATYIALAVFGHSFAAVLGIRIVQGFCSAGLMVSITPAIAAWFPSGEIGRAMGFPSIGAGIGTIIGLNTGPQLVHSTGSWQYGTSMLAFIAAAALAIALAASRLAHSYQSLNISAEQPHNQLSPTRTVLRLPIFRTGVVVIALACWINMSFSDLAPGFLSVNPPIGAGFGARRAGGLMSVFAISSVISAPIAGFLMDKVFIRQNRLVILLGFLISACAYPAILLPVVHDHQFVIYAVLLFGGVANPFVNVTLMTMAAKLFDIGTMGRICGLWMSISFFAGAAGVLVGSVSLRASHDYRVSMLIIGIASLCGALAVLLLPKRLPGRDSSILWIGATGHTLAARSPQ